MQFWNLFNARYFKTKRFLIKDLYDMVNNPSVFKKYYSSGFITIVLIIIIGQILIVNVFGNMFGVSALTWKDWIWIMIFTCPILLIGEIGRLIIYGIKSK